MSYRRFLRIGWIRDFHRYAAGVQHCDSLAIGWTPALERSVATAPIVVFSRCWESLQCAGAGGSAVHLGSPACIQWPARLGAAPTWHHQGTTPRQKKKIVERDRSPAVLPPAVPTKIKAPQKGPNVERETGFEPATFSLGRGPSQNLSNETPPESADAPLAPRAPLPGLRNFGELEHSERCIASWDMLLQ